MEDGETLSGHNFRPVHLWPDIVDHLEMMTIGRLAYYSNTVESIHAGIGEISNREIM